MEFCKTCDNMLYIQIDMKEPNDGDDVEGESSTTDGSSLIYYCKNCDEKYENIDKTKCVYHLDYNMDEVKREAVVNKHIVNDTTLPKAHGIKCPNDNCPSKKTNIVYIKNDDDNMKYCYICVNCHNAGITPNTW